MRNQESRDNRPNRIVSRALVKGKSLASMRSVKVEGRNWTFLKRPGVSLEVTDDGSRVFKNRSQTPIYFVHGGTPFELKRLFPLISGVSFKHRVFRLEVQAESIPNGCYVLILEFDERGVRCGENRISSSGVFAITMSQHTARIMMAVRASKNSEVRFSQFSIQEDPEIEPTAVKVRRLLSNSFSIEDSPATVKVLADSLRETADSIENLRSLGVNHSIDARNPGPIAETRDKSFRELLSAFAHGFPESNGGDHFPAVPLRAAVVADEYMYNFYKDSFEEVIYFSPDEIETQLANCDFDIFIYSTCWKGLKGDEWRGIKFREKPMQAFERILEHCSIREIPTIFQSIEDPSNFEYFLPIAQKLNYIFTSDIDCVSRYISALGHSRVHYLRYGANPVVNNPIGSNRVHFSRAIFAGSYPERYQERCEDMNLVFQNFEDVGNDLIIFDRNFNTGELKFPEDVQRSVFGLLPHSDLQKIHKLFRYSINFNSIKDSPTMCAMRIYELQGQGKPILSNYALSVFNTFPEIRILPSPSNIKIGGNSDSDFSYLMDLYDSYRLMARFWPDHAGPRVMEDMAIIAGAIQSASSSPELLVLVENIDHETRVMLSKQRGLEFKVATMESLSEIDGEIETPYYLAAMSLSKEYDPFYLRSRLNAFIYSKIDFATQPNFDNFDNALQSNAHEFVAESGSRFETVVKSTHPEAVEFITGGQQTITGAGYAADIFAIGYLEYLSKELNGRLSEPRLSVIVPVYNNGAFLWDKCIKSLLRNDCWNQMEVLLIDDGSTDEATLATCQRLEELFTNVNYFSFMDGGSGSASRPRNKGIELARCELVTFLDPDNEISQGGYDVLIREYDISKNVGQPLDFISGYQVKVGKTSYQNGRHANGQKNLILNSKKEFFDRGKFPVVSTQAAVIDRNFLLENNLRFIENAAGQDTLFGWQLLYEAQASMFVDTAHLIYYAEREGSVTNDVSVKFFEKSLVLEEAQVAYLNKNGLMEAYKLHHLEKFVRGWYLDKLGKVSSNYAEEAKEKLEEILELYGVSSSKLEEKTGE